MDTVRLSGIFRISKSELVGVRASWDGYIYTSTGYAGRGLPGLAVDVAIPLRDKG